jgi:hypothetical protein
MDWNNAFSSLPQFWEEIAKRSHFLYFETSSDQETITLGREIKRRYVPKGARNVIMAGHSSTGQLSFSEGDPRLEAIEDSTRTLEAADQSRFRDEGFSDILMAGGNVLVIGCSAGGEDAKVPSGQAVSQVIRSIFPQAGTVFAPHLPISLGDINVRYGNQGEIEDVTFRGGTVRN